MVWRGAGPAAPRQLLDVTLHGQPEVVDELVRRRHLRLLGQAAVDGRAFDLLRDPHEDRPPVVHRRPGFVGLLLM
jgi:hypothetical protein